MAAVWARLAHVDALTGAQAAREIRVEPEPLASRETTPDQEPVFEHTDVATLQDTDHGPEDRESRVFMCEGMTYHEGLVYTSRDQVRWVIVGVTTDGMPLVARMGFEGRVLNVRDGWFLRSLAEVARSRGPLTATEDRITRRY
jgi:hypothetical protein